MSQTAPIIPLKPEPLPLHETNGQLLRQVFMLSLPVFAEHALHILVGWNDTYLANHIHRYDAVSTAVQAQEVAAGAAVGTMSYVLWFIGLMVSSVGSGSTAIIARAVGAKHRSLANSICGQSISLGLLIGSASCVVMYVFAAPIATFSGLDGDAHRYAFEYLHILSFTLPFSMVMFIANSCLRGAGDTFTPAITMIVVDVINMAFSFALTYGWFGLPNLGFDGIAWGTSIAYVAGGVIQFVVLIIGRGGIRLFLHRMQPHWHNLKRLLRIGLPGGMADLLHWIANFGVLKFVNEMGAVAGNAHNIAIRIESMSYMMGYAVATAVTTAVGQSLGMKRPERATRMTYLGYGMGGAFMTLMGIGFICLGKYPARMFSADPEVQWLVVQCLLITGFIQSGFAGALIFGGALRGAGDTFAVMLLLLFNMFFVRLLGVYLVGHVMKLGLAAVWIVLAGELAIRGGLMFTRFRHGGWKQVAV
ncbi:MAG TPA: MATE family efflux transporter [Tepidisphaeraceae bacterium]|nr:MATE family efflux transporter [Tepidisphaeraceae bacterium]